MNFSEYSVPQPDLETTRIAYAALHQRLAVAADVGACLAIVADWDVLLCEFKEWSNLTEIRFHQDTTNPDFKAALDAVNELSPKFSDLEVGFKQALLTSPHRLAIQAAMGDQLFARWECNTRCFASEIEADLAAESKLQSDYTALVASAEIEFQGERLTVSQLGKYTSGRDRSLRQAACEARSRWFADNAPALDKIYDDLVQLRHGMARKLGYEDFIGLGYQRMQRIGYGVAEVAAFRDEVRREVVPLALEIASLQKNRLELDELEFWDSTTFSLEGNPTPQGDHDWMINRATEMFSEMGHGLAEFFEEMKERGVMDLKSRKGKAGGGFCSYLNQYGFPFIFANFNGTRGDVDVFTHEVGHAFQSYSSRNQVMSDLGWPTTEACEIHSMGLEFLTWPHMDKFYGTEAAEELRRVHLMSYLKFLCYGVAVDHFQHLVYAAPQATPEQRNSMWLEMEALYLPWHKYTPGLPAEASGRLWQQKQHLYASPFYYVDYCLALTGALQFWCMARMDEGKAMQAYAKLCKLGGSLSYNGLLESAGLESPFHAGCLRRVVADARTYLGC